MKIDLDQTDLANMVRGTSPFRCLNHPVVQKYGTFYGGFASEWSWNRYELETLSKHKLWILYLICKADLEYKDPAKNHSI